MKYFILFFSFYLSGACTHFEEKRRREVNRNYVFSIDKLGRNWPEGFQVEGKYSGKGPQVEYIKQPYKVDGDRLIEAHGVWLLKNKGRWVKDSTIGGQQ